MRYPIRPLLALVVAISSLTIGAVSTPVDATTDVPSAGGWSDGPTAEVGSCNISPPSSEFEKFPSLIPETRWIEQPGQREIAGSPVLQRSDHD